MNNITSHNLTFPLILHNYTEWKQKSWMFIENWNTFLIMCLLFQKRGIN